MDVPTGTAPYLLAILTCDQVITDAETQKKTLVGIFDRVASATFPTQHPLTLFAKLTDASGDYRFTAQFVQTLTDRLLGEAEIGTAHIDDPQRPVDLVLRVTVGIPQAGLYEFRLMANNTYLGSITITVEHLSAQ